MQRRWFVSFLFVLAALSGPYPVRAAPPEPAPVIDAVRLSVARPRSAVLDVHHGAAASFLLADLATGADRPAPVAANGRLALAADYEALFLPLTAGWASFRLTAWRVTDTGREQLATDGAEIALFGPGRRAGHLALPLQLAPGLHHLVLVGRTATRPVGVPNWTVDEAEADLWLLASDATIGAVPPMPLAPTPRGGLYVGDHRGATGADSGGALNFETGHNSELVMRTGDPLTVWSLYELWWAAGSRGAARAELAILERAGRTGADPAPLASETFETKEAGPRLLDGHLATKVVLNRAGNHQLVARLTTTVMVGDQVFTDQDEVPFSVKVLPGQPPVGDIAGHVWGEDGAPLAGVAVIAHAADGQPLAKTRVDGDGAYLLAGLAPGKYQVQALPSDQNYLGEWWNDRPERARADIVAVAAGQTVDGIDFKLAPGAVISGRVTDAAGNGLAGIEIAVGPLTRPLSSGGGAVPPVAPADTDGLARTRTNAEGHYAVDHLPAGAWWVRAADPEGRYLTEFFKDKSTLAEADPVLLTGGQQVDDIDFALAPGGAIAGQVRAEALPGTVVVPLAGIVVEARDPTHLDQVLASGITNRDGRYKLGGLRERRYLLRAADPTGAHRVEWYKEATGPEGAEAVTVRPGDTTAPIDFSLAGAEGSPKLALDPAASSIPSGGTGRVSVTVADVRNLGAFEASLTWDPRVVTVADVEVGPFLGSTGRQVLPVAPQLDAEHGLLRYAAASVGSQPGASGDGVLFVLHLKAVAEGETKLAFGDSVLTDPRGQALRHERQDGVVRVGGCLLGDFDCNCVIDIRDVMAVVARWGTRRGDADYDRRYDLDNDGDIDIVDVQIEAGLWGQRCPAASDPIAPRGSSSSLRPTKLSGAALSLVAEPGSARVGERVVVRVDIAEVVDLAAFQIALAYDTTRLRFVGAEVGALLGSGGRATLPLGPRDEDGRVHFGAAALPGGGTASGDGQLARLTFEVTAPGAAAVSVDEALTVDGAQRAVAASGGAATIQGQPNAATWRIHLPLVTRRR